MNFEFFRNEINIRNISIKELVNDIFLKIDSNDPDINSYIQTTKEKAILQAENLDKIIKRKYTFFP